MLTPKSKTQTAHFTWLLIPSPLGTCPTTASRMECDIDTDHKLTMLSGTPTVYHDPQVTIYQLSVDKITCMKVKTIT